MAHYYKIGESLARITKTKESTNISGVLATPRISRNGVLYFPEQLAKQHGKVIAIDIEHAHERTIGSAKLRWNSELQRLEYNGRINDPALEAKLKGGEEYHTSLEGICQSEEICSENACYTACSANLNIERMAIVMEPGIPETTVQVTEKRQLSLNEGKDVRLTLVAEPFADYKDFDDCVDKNKDKEDPQAYCGEIKKKTEADNSQTSKTAGSQRKMTEPKPSIKEEECPEGKEWDKEAGQCVDKKMEVTPELEKKLGELGWFKPKKESDKPAVIDRDSTLGKKAAEAVDDCGCKAAEKREKFPQLVGKEELELIINPIIENLKLLNKEIGERGKENVKEGAMKPTATVGIGKMTALQESYSRFAEFWNNREIPAIYWKVDKAQWLKDHDYDARTGRFTVNKTVAESITATNVPAITFQRRIILDPTDITRYAVRAHVNYMEAGQGTDLVNWYTGDAGSAGFEDQTVGTTFTDRTVTVTRQQAQLSKRVMGVKVGYYDVHDIPGGILELVNEAIGLRAIEDENSYIVGTGSGGFSESGFTPTNWIRGDTGATITSENTASVVFKREGIVHAKKKIAAQGFDTTPGAQACVMRPEQWAELMLDTNLNNFYQYARPDITQQGTLELLYGCELNTSTAIPFNDDTTDMWRAVMLTKGMTSGLATDGALEFEADRRNDVAQVFVSGRHRPIGKRILEMSGCRISTTK